MARRPGKRMKALGGLPGLMAMGWASAVAAQPAAGFALSWSGPAGCPTAENVEGRVNALLGGGPRAGSVADVRASGQVERADNGFRLLLTMGVGTPSSSRVIEARTCEELAGAAAIAIALLARSTAEDGSATSPVEDTPPSPAPEAPAPVPPPKRESTSPKKAATAEKSPASLRLLIDAPVGAVGWGSLPSAGLGLGAAVGVRWKALRVTVRGELWQPQTRAVSGFVSRYTLHSGRADACLIQVAHGVELGPCLGVAAQRLAGEGLGSETFSASSRSGFWFSGVGGIFASLPTPGFAPLRFFGAASVLVSPTRPRFVIEQLGPVHQPSLAAPRLDLGCEWIF